MFEEILFDLAKDGVASLFKDYKRLSSLKELSSEQIQHLLYVIACKCSDNFDLVERDNNRKALAQMMRMLSLIGVESLGMTRTRDASNFFLKGVSDFFVMAMPGCKTAIDFAIENEAPPEVFEWLYQYGVAFNLFDFQTCNMKLNTAMSPDAMVMPGYPIDPLSSQISDKLAYALFSRQGQQISLMRNHVNLTKDYDIQAGTKIKLLDWALVEDRGPLMAGVPMAGYIPTPKNPLLVNFILEAVKMQLVIRYLAAMKVIEATSLTKDVMGIIARYDFGSDFALSKEGMEFINNFLDNFILGKELDLLNRARTVFEQNLWPLYEDISHLRAGRFLPQKAKQEQENAKSVSNSDIVAPLMLSGALSVVKNTKDKKPVEPEKIDEKNVKSRKFE